MKKFTPDAKIILNRLGKLSALLKDLDAGADKNECFDNPLKIIQETLHFDVSVLYKVSNVVEDMLLLEVVKVLDPDKVRMDLKEGRKLRLFLDARDKRYVNEVNAFMNKGISGINVAGMGCDLMGYVFFPETHGGGYLFGGDFFGKESAIEEFEISAMEIMCNLLTTILLKTRFKEQAEHDHLTKLFNSGKIKGELGRLLKRFDRKPETYASIAIGDIDFFKKVNDTYGHIQGDVILKSVGKILKSCLREYFDMAGRYGGEEFLLIFDETDKDSALKIVERLRNTIENFSFPRVDESGKPADNEFLNITMSFGIADLAGKQRPKSVADWVGRADQALYKSKENGRNRTTVFSG